MTMTNKSFESKCKCGHLESNHKPQTVDSSKSMMKFQMEPKRHLAMGIAPNTSYDASVLGGLIVGGTSILSGNVQVGDSSSDTLTVDAEVDSDFIPNTNDSQD